MSNDASERHAMWLAINNLTAEAVQKQQGGASTEQLYTELRRKIQLLRDTEHLEAGMAAFDASSEGLGLIDAAARRGGENALSWLADQVKANLDRAAALDLV